MYSGFSSYLGFFFFILSCVWLGGPCSCSARTDSIKLGEGLPFSENLLVSAQGTFTLGFFSLDTGTYLGVWYTSDVNNKKVWVANRDKPISGTNANLMLDGNGTLMIIHSGGDPIVLNSNQASRNSIATLLDSGNFVVSALNSDGSVKQTLWESFDDPTDTLLPGMKLGINLKTGQNWSLASWINEQVPDPGTFTLEWNGTQLVMKRRGDIYWSSGILKDRGFEFIQTHHNIYYFISVCNDNEIYFSYSVQDRAISKWVLNWRGGFFDTYGTLFVKEDMCDRYDKYPGCAVQEPPTCRTRDFQFMKQSVLNSGYPSLMNIDTSLGLSDCQAICRNNCSCTACNTVFTNGTGCQFWRDKLPRAQVGDANQEELYVLSSSEDIGKPWWIWIIILVVVVFLFLLAVFCCSQRNSRGDREGTKVKLPEVGPRKKGRVRFSVPLEVGPRKKRRVRFRVPLEVGASGTTGDLPNPNPRPFGT
ncbi:S-locus-specific glycoprotein S6-like isoform X1 [Vitis riparia]|uniref:S-locus-specific glycoprotein S6-like isoform X1 n=1 Tax=Vitis riparia TaxID=96939 RepID=UPI00155A95C2|nr:S-locus-specific glycoprotein S6-like isoform X1 [Vitis riparia]